MKKVAIIGSGPSALFAAKTILENSKNIKIYIYDRGKSPQNRQCNMQKSSCKNCKYCNVINGGGGSGLFSDGKLVLDLTSGGKSAGITCLSSLEQKNITNIIKKTFEKFDGVSEFKDIPPYCEQEKYAHIFEQENLRIKCYPVMHMGTHNLFKITCNFIDYLVDTFYNRIVFNFETEVTDILKDNDEYVLVTSHGRERFGSIVAAVGKAGANWLKLVLQKLNCTFEKHDYYFGVRLETQAFNIKKLLEISFDPKIYRIINERKVKIHCVCRNGDIRFYNYNGIISVGGHSPYTKSNLEFSQMDRANFNVMLSFDKTEIPPDEILKRIKSVSGEKVLAQKLDDYIANKETSVWGNIVPKNEEMVHRGNIHKIMNSIDSDFSVILIDFINSISKISEGVADKDNIIYAPAIEWDMDTVKVDNHMETSQKNLFAVGDGAGISQGIVFSSATGIIAGYEIASRYNQ